MRGDFFKVLHWPSHHLTRGELASVLDSKIYLDVGRGTAKKGGEKKAEKSTGASEVDCNDRGYNRGDSQSGGHRGKERLIRFDRVTSFFHFGRKQPLCELKKGGDFSNLDKVCLEGDEDIACQKKD